MKKLMYGILMSALVLTIAASVLGAETKMKPSASELKKMSTFLSNFTEQGFMVFDIEADGADEPLHLGAPDAVSDLIRFGIRHNYINNFKSRVAKCETKDCQYGSLVIDGKYVAESVKKYFDLDLKNQSAMEGDPPYFYDGKLYHFEGADGEATYYAQVKEVFKDGNVLRMTGELYNADDESERPAVFEATAKPYKFGGKETWAILSMNVIWND
ncbi:MAG: hypothetical protein LBI74_04630 [Synergistaceae bacterium]|jgi:hypothetical protein|nr:hypothetical protein [Synergistaceae bacterium]